jgi:hypothetical protein
MVRRGPCELRIMPADLPDNDVTVYLVLNDYRTGLAYVETALDEADLETIIRNFIAGEYDSALCVVAFNAAEGWSRDVSEDIAGEIVDRVYDADETLTEGTKRFIDRHLDIERRPRAPSVLRDAGIVRKKLA